MTEGKPKAQQAVIRFGEFELDVPSQTLSLRGSPVKLQRQPFKVLKLLIQRAPDIVTRDEIRQHVWGDQVHVEPAQNINFCIRQIRAALGDTSEGRFIETLPKQGYRFVAPVDAVPASPGQEAANAGISERQPHEGAQLTEAARPRSVTRQWLIAGLAAYVLIVVIAGVGNRFSERNRLTRVALLSKITTYPGDEREPSLSPDGRHVAFSWGGDKGGNRDIYVVPVGGQQPIRLTTDPAEDVWPAWSPNGKQIAFVRRRTGTQADIMLVPARGGPERRLYQIQWSAMVNARMLAWSPDGRSLCFTSEVGASEHHSLFLLSIASGTVKGILPEENDGVGDSSPAFSPDAKWLAFTRFEYPFNSNLLLQRLSPDLMAEGRPIVVKDAGIYPTAPVWMPDAKRILFLDRSRIMEATIGGTARPIYVSDSFFNEITMSGANSRLVASLKTRHEENWYIPLTSKGMKAGGAPEPLVRSTGGEGHPRFSPDGRWLAFISGRSGASEVWLAETDGTNPRQLTHSSFYIAGYPRWSPDSQFLAFHGRLPKESEIYIIGIERGLLRQMTRRKPGLMGPSWSVDGQTLYADTVEGGITKTYRIPVNGGDPQFLLEASDAFEVPGRKLLIYEQPDHFGIYSRSLDGDVTNNPEQLLVADFLGPQGGYFPMADGIYYVGCDSSGTPRMFRFYSFDTGRSVDVAPSPTDLGLGLSVTSDKTRLAYAANSRGSEDLILIELQ
jgi:Tol biopolymer transport system component/DNA-binding winged helix-turn-helix (wHTH) protein